MVRSCTIRSIGRSVADCAVPAGVIEVKEDKMPVFVSVSGETYNELLLKASMLDAMLNAAIDGAEKGYRDGTLMYRDVDNIVDVAVEMFQKEKKAAKLESFKAVKQEEADDF